MGKYSGFGIAVEVDSQSVSRGTIKRGVIYRLGKIEKNARDVTPVLQKIRKSFYAGERQQFASLGQGHWAPDTAMTLARKARRGEDPRTLRATGELYRAMALGQGPGAIDKVGKDELILGTNLKKGVVAQRTTDRKRRRILVVSKHRRKAWVKMLREHLTGGTP